MTVSQFDSGSATFTRTGLYAISIEYFENSGSTGLNFYGSGATGAAAPGKRRAI